MSDNEYPEYSETAEMGERGRWIVEGVVRDSLHWLFRETPKSDLGIDGFVEILNKERQSQGRLFALQLKTGRSYFKEPNEEGFLFRGKRKHLKYWLEFSLPVIVVLCDPETSNCYWQHISADNVTRTEKGWTMTVPSEQTLAAAHKNVLHKLTEPPQPVDFIPFALYRLLIEKFQGILIAQEIETPRDFRGFEYLANFSDFFAVISYIYKPAGALFLPRDIDGIMKRLDECATGCGWHPMHGSPKVLLFLVAETVEQLRLSEEFKSYTANRPQIVLYRVECNFRFGIWLTELDDDDHPIELYERDLSGGK